MTSSHVDRPTIYFIEYRSHQQYGRVAVFRIINSSPHTFSYEGYDATFPLYEFRVQTTSGWQFQSPHWCPSGAEYRALTPKSSVEFEVYGRRGIDTAFAVGVCFEEGTPVELARRQGSELATFSRWFRRVTHVPAAQPELSWSQPINL